MWRCFDGLSRGQSTTAKIRDIFGSVVIREVSWYSGVKYFPDQSVVLVKYYPDQRGVLIFDQCHVLVKYCPNQRGFPCHVLVKYCPDQRGVLFFDQCCVLVKYCPDQRGVLIFKGKVHSICITQDSMSWSERWQSRNECPDTQEASWFSGNWMS